MKKIVLTFILLTALFDSGFSKNIKKNASPCSFQQVRVFQNGEEKTLSSTEIDNLLNKRVPAILEKLSKAGIDPCKVFVTNLKGLSSK